MRALDLLRLLLVFAGGIVFPILIGVLFERIRPPGWLYFILWFAFPYLGYRKTLLLMPGVQGMSTWTRYFAVHGLSLLLTLATLAIGLLWAVFLAAN